VPQDVDQLGQVFQEFMKALVEVCSESHLYHCDN
jgi:hypothetical protein